MHIWLVDYDGKLPNLALMRLSTYHKGQGDTISLKRGDAWPELFDVPDKLYISCIFRWNRDTALRLADAWGDIAQVGGTGVDIERTLPPDVADLPPDYELYGETRAIGFISRGCIRNCPWCVVPKKEGQLARVSTARDIVGNRHEVLFFDNNFLALPDHHKDLEWLAAHKVKIDFNQGLDARLVTEDNAPLLARCNWIKQIRFALDFSGEIQAVKRTIDLMTANGLLPSRIMLYVLIGFSSLESDVKRLLLCRDWGVKPYPMGYRNLETGEEPAKGWDKKLYRKYRRLLIRWPTPKVWADFEQEVGKGAA